MDSPSKQSQPSLQGSGTLQSITISWTEDQGSSGSLPTQAWQLCASES